MFWRISENFGLVVRVFIEGQANPTWRERASPEGSRALAIKLRICWFCSADVTQQNRKSRVCNKLSPPLCQEGEWSQAVVWDMGMGLGIWVHGLPCGSSVSPHLYKSCSTGADQLCNVIPARFWGLGFQELTGKVGSREMGQEGLTPAVHLQGSEVPHLR